MRRVGVGNPVAVRQSRRRGSVGSFGGFSPDQVAGLVAWYDFSDITTLWKDTARTTPVTADADVILGVTDKSAAGKHLSEVTNGPAYKVGIQNGKSVARFDAVNDRLGVSGVGADTSFTVLIVATKRSAVGATTATIWANNGNAQLTSNTAFDATKYVWFANQAAGSTPTFTAATWRVMTIRVNSAASLDIFGDGGTPINLDPNDAVTTAVDMYIGNNVAANGPSDSDIAEVVRYDSALSSADLNSVGNYLAGKYGLTWTAV